MARLVFITGWIFFFPPFFILLFFFSLSLSLPFSEVRFGNTFDMINECWKCTLCYTAGISLAFDEERDREQADPGKEGKGLQLFCQ